MALWDGSDQRTPSTNSCQLKHESMLKQSKAQGSSFVQLAFSFPFSKGSAPFTEAVSGGLVGGAILFCPANQKSSQLSKFLVGVWDVFPHADIKIAIPPFEKLVHRFFKPHNVGGADSSNVPQLQIVVMVLRRELLIPKLPIDPR